MTYSVLEICAGGGGQAVGLEAAGFELEGAVEIEPVACSTLRLNRPHWNVIEKDVQDIDGRQYRGIDLFAGGIPCPPFSIAGKQLGPDDERDLFPQALRLISEINPAAIMLENVKGFASEKFEWYRKQFLQIISAKGYAPRRKVLNASDFGVPQL